MPDSSLLIRSNLSNGLQVLLYPTFDAPVASFWVFYRVGSRNELPGQTGVSHWVEHMMFKGTPSVPNGELMLRVNQNGGEINAFTSYDYTAYHETLPADRIALAIELEADRMANLLVDAAETESERTVILSERQGAFNNPSYVLWDETIATAFRAHSYRHFVIGHEHDLQTMTRDDLYGYYRRWYSPENAIVVVSGAIDAASLMTQIEQHFGAIAKSDAALPVPVVEPEQMGERRVVLHHPAPAPEVLTGYHVPGAGHPDSMPLEVLAAVLSGAGGRMGKSARLPRNLVATGRMRSASANYLKGIDPFLFLVGAMGLPDGNVDAIERDLTEQLDSVLAAPLPEDEVERARKQLTSAFHYSTESVTEQGHGIGDAAIYGDVDDFFTYPEQIAAVTPADVMRVAETYIRPANRTVGQLIPSEPASGGEGPSMAALRFGIGGAGAPKLQPFEQTSLGQGITLLTQPQPSDPVVSARIRINTGSVDDPAGKHGLANLTGQMLLRGNREMSREAFEDACDELGAAIGVTSSRLHTEISVTCIADDLDACLALIGESLNHPTFSDDQLVLTRREAEAAIFQAEDNTMAVADQAVRELLFPEAHPLRHRATGERSGISAISREDLASFHERHVARSEMTIAVVGGFAETGSLAEQLRARLAPGSRDATERASLRVALPDQERTTRVRVAGKSQADIAFVRPVAGVRDASWYALEIGDVVLGQLGMMGRIGDSVRQEQGLAYYAYGSVTPGKDQSLWFCRSGVDPSNVERAIGSVKQVISQVIADGISEDEYESAIQLMTGRTALAMQTNAGIAALLLMIDEYALGLDYVERYPGLLRATTRASVNEALARSLSPEQMLIAVAGPDGA